MKKLSIGTKTNNHTLGFCDYLCDGIDDQIEFNNAIIELTNANGGEIQVLSGTYNLTDKINMIGDDIVIRGNIGNTMLNICFDTEYGFDICKMNNAKNSMITNFIIKL